MDMNWLKGRWAALKAWWVKWYGDLTKPEMNPLWQMGHFLGGALIPALFVVADPTHAFRQLVIGTVLTDGVWVICKEFGWDIIVEWKWDWKNGFKSGLDDAYHYWAGSALTWLVYGIGGMTRA
jgi:hypothetical protein